MTTISRKSQTGAKPRKPKPATKAARAASVAAARQRREDAMAKFVQAVIVATLKVYGGPIAQAASQASADAVVAELAAQGLLSTPGAKITTVNRDEAGNIVSTLTTAEP
jgi:hypothetical protein